LGEAPERVAGEAEADDEDERPPERLVGQRLERPTVILGSAAAADGHVEREDRDKEVRGALGDESEAPAPLDPTALLDVLGHRGSVPPASAPQSSGPAHNENEELGSLTSDGCGDLRG
jgi:hypothetical protein